MARVLNLSRTKTLLKILLPATLPYMFTGFRLSLGIAWLVIVAAEMLTGAPGVGGFLWQEYYSLIYEHIILCILTIGVIGFILDRLMGLFERFLSAWAKQAQDSGLRVLQQFTKTILGHRAGLLNWYDHPISTGPLEAANNKLKLFQRRAFGDRDLKFLKLRILAMHKCRFASVG